MKDLAFGRNRGPRALVQTRRRSGSTTRTHPEFSGKAWPSAEHMTMLNAPPGTSSITALATLWGLGAEPLLQKLRFGPGAPELSRTCFYSALKQEIELVIYFHVHFPFRPGFRRRLQLVEAGFPNSAFMFEPALRRCEGFGMQTRTCGYAPFCGK